MRQDVLVFGGLGDPKSSVVRLYEGLLNQLKQQYSIIAIDPLVTSRSLIATASCYQFPYSEQYESFASYLQQTSPRSIACVLILTPVGTHLSILSQIDHALPTCDFLLVVEKPSFSLSEVHLGFNRVVPQLKEKGASFYFIDTALVSPVFDHCFLTNLHRTMGVPEKIVAVATDNPVTIQDELSEYSFENRIKFLNNRCLLDLDKNGGGGFGFDMGIHALAGLVRYLQYIDLLDAQIEFTNVKLECLEDSRLNRSIGAETHLYANGVIKYPGASCDIFLDAGKASDTWDRRLELHYPERVIVLGFGTLIHPPYIWQSDKPDSEAIVFDVSESGYSMHFNDILNALGYEVNNILTKEESQTLMAKSMNLLNQVFNITGTYTMRENQMEWVSIHTAKGLSKNEEAIRIELNQFLAKLV
ncbi:hypothetical protein [Vibrio sp. YIC-376]|uniref:hypothetical protein n=1 Tax=Vibrio sp. YIC-376 TaxID=3136162 RepID=UPI00402A8754